VYVIGDTASRVEPPYFPTTPGAFQGKYGGGASDAFVVKITEAPVIAPNDGFANRLRLRGSRLTVLADNTSASNETGEPNHAEIAGGKSLWWSWTAPTNGQLAVTTAGSNFDTLLAVYTGAWLQNLISMAANDNENNDLLTSRVRFPVAAGAEYQIVVDGHQGQAGVVCLSLTFSAPANDDFANRIAITNFPVTVHGSNLDATREPTEFFHADDLTSRSVWWAWTSPTNGNVAVSTLGSSLNTALAIYTGTALDDLKLVAQNDDYADGVWTSQVTFHASLGSNYVIAVDGVYETAGQIQLSLMPGDPPPNDNFMNRTLLTGFSTNLIASNVNATEEPGELELAGFPYASGTTVWWSWLAPTNGQVTITTTGSSFNTRLAVFTNSTLSELKLVSSNDNQEGAWENYHASRLSFMALMNTHYQIMVDGARGSHSGEIHLALWLYQPPRILPASLQFQPDGAFAFRVIHQTAKIVTFENTWKCQLKRLANSCLCCSCPALMHSRIAVCIAKKFP
jgi:hypothetical protein